MIFYHAKLTDLADILVVVMVSQENTHQPASVSFVNQDGCHI